MRIDPLPPLKSGLERPISRTSPKMATVKTPALPTLRVGLSGKTDTAKPFNAEKIRKAYFVDGYVRQSNESVVELVMKNGWRLDGEEEPVKYLKKRLYLMGLMAQPAEPFDLTLEKIIRDFIIYANSFVFLGRADTMPLPRTHPISDKGYLAALFPIGAQQIEPAYAKEDPTRQVGWVQSVKQPQGQVTQKLFTMEQILHIYYCREPNTVFGVPTNASAVDDIDMLRQSEEHVLNLIFKNLNPLIHHATPSITNDGQGRPEDIGATKRMYSEMTDGILITPPNHTIKVIGSESQAIRAEGYIKGFRNRGLSGLASSSVLHGDLEGSSAAAAELMTRLHYQKVRHFRWILSVFLTHFLVNPLLQEGGFDPIWNEADTVVWGWNEVDDDWRTKVENHYLNMWDQDAVTFSELRKLLGLPAKAEESELHVHKIKIPQVVAGRIGIDPMGMTEDEIIKLTQQPTKDKTANKSIGGSGASAPSSNQHSQ